MTTIDTRIKISRSTIVAACLKRDGNKCMHPDCDRELDFEAVGNREVTIDHWYPQSWCYAQGWTQEETWDISNLRLMCKSCNAKKGDLVPFDDGSLPAKPKSRAEQRANKSLRPEVCVTCESGRLLGPEEMCDVCESGPMPPNFPRWAKLKPNECSHSGIWWCWCCMSGVVDREPAFVQVFGAEDELSA